MKSLPFAGPIPPVHQRVSVFRIFLLVLLLYSLPIVLYAQSSEALSIGTLKAVPGEIVSGNLVVDSGVDQGTTIPVSIICGTKPGPVLTLLAGLHGTEYVPIIALQRLKSLVQPNELSGTLVLIHVANTLSFKEKMVYNNPVDHKNMNRSFPGKKEGTLTERMTYTITSEVLPKSDYYIDLHGGEFNERIIDYLYFYYNCPDPEMDKKSYELAHAMSNKYLFPFDYTWIADTAASEFSDFEALRQGASAITLEWGDRGIVTAEELEVATSDLLNVMRKTGMLEGEAYTNEHPVYLENEQAMTCNYDGIFYPLTDRGQYVIKGTKFGYTTDYWGKVVEEYFTPISGIVIVTIATPAIKKGQVVGRVAEVRETFERK
ncbi:succinylglutamate desuccinylase/aspartoacylase family protein [Draconibacterium mangrovi]|uniref:succinylglutamate desuccinylase/aspartoacylase family protein n=1 Tax=Draconibacterium mangrovi TaxID=2697469 RepID=UPI0013D826C4|nr:succinylglutamate desuccinylase/aspartoacylase family protein [Draconibacterium mangrovi]